MHAVGGIWSLISVGLFARPDNLRIDIIGDNEHYGLFQV